MIFIEKKIHAQKVKAIDVLASKSSTNEEFLFAKELAKERASSCLGNDGTETDTLTAEHSESKFSTDDDISGFYYGDGEGGEEEDFYLTY